MADTGNSRIQKFTADGVFEDKWGTIGSSTENFDTPLGVAVDNDGHIYVTDSHNGRIQKFTTDGEYMEWGAVKGLANPVGITVDRDGYVYVAVEGKSCVRKFSPDGQFVNDWGTEGSGDEAFSHPKGIATDGNGYLYVADSRNNRIQKLTSDGQFVTKWGSGNGDGEFNLPYGIAIDDSYVYVADSNHNRIQKFTQKGIFKIEWGISGGGVKEFQKPRGIAVDSDNYLYVADWGNHRIQKFTPDGEFVIQWGQMGSENGEFNLPYGIAIDSNGHVYVADSENHRIQKFTRSGEFIAKWGEDGEFKSPKGVATDSEDHVYVTDDSHKVQKFTPDGEFVKEWGGEGNGDGELYFPYGITIDGNDNIYVADSQNHRIQQFSTEGEFISKWGELGINPGQMNSPYDIAVSPDGDVYITDGYNHRIQKFKKLTSHSNNKAIIVAGGGPYPGNNLWNATQMCASFAYRTLTYQGFSKKNIAYLTSDTDLDLDGNGISDDTEAATNENFSSVLTDWASGANDLILYIVNHGGKDVFLMNETEILSASQLNTWLDIVQETISGKVILIYDACNSGSFLSSLTFPGQGGRILITSAHPGQQAHFINQGMISFSDYFWTHTFNGRDIHDSFYLAKEAIHEAVGTQTPLLSGNVPVSGVYIGNGTQIHWQNPVIKTASYNPETNLLHAEAEDEDGVARVWAVISLAGCRLHRLQGLLLLFPQTSHLKRDTRCTPRWSL